MADLKGLGEELRADAKALFELPIIGAKSVSGRVRQAAAIIEHLDRETLAGTIQDFMLTRYSRFITEGSAADFADAIISHLQGETS